MQPYGSKISDPYNRRWSIRLKFSSFGGVRRSREVVYDYRWRGVYDHPVAPRHPSKGGEFKLRIYYSLFTTALPHTTQGEPDILIIGVLREDDPTRAKGEAASIRGGNL